MKFIIAFGVLCLMSAVICKKAEESNEENIDDTWSQSQHSHDQVKKYKDPKTLHHHHSKQKYFENGEHKHHEKVEGKKSKHIPKQAPQEVAPEDAELQANLHTSKKHLKDKHFRDTQQDLHLQDLAYEERLRKEEKHSKSPHHYQRGQHKTGHFSENIDAKQSQEAERKLFADQNPREQHGKHSHSVLEDSFEALQDKKPKQDGKKHNKKYNKHKKASDKMKKEKKGKNYKKEKKNKNDKKYKKW